MRLNPILSLLPCGLPRGCELAGQVLRRALAVERTASFPLAIRSLLSATLGLMREDESILETVSGVCMAGQ